MRGSPLWQLLAIAVAFVAMGLPVWRLTHPAPVAEAELPPTGGMRANPPTTTQTTRLDAEAEFAPTPAEFSLSYLGTPLLQGKGEAKATLQVNTSIPVDGADLVLHVVWPTGAGQADKRAAAARVVVNLSDGRQVEKSFWSPDGTGLDAVLSVPGKAAGAGPRGE